MALFPNLNTNNYSTSTTPALVGDLRTTVSGIQVPNSSPEPTAVAGVPVAACFEIQSTTGLLLIPRLTDANITAITTANPAGLVDGMIYYNSTNAQFTFRQGGASIPLPTGGGIGNVVGPNNPVTGTLAYFDSNLSPNIQDTNSGIFGIDVLAAQLIVSAAPGTANQLATFTGTTLNGGAGGVITGVPVTISGAGAIAGVTTIQAGLGVVGAPSFTFTGNATTGIYSETAGVSVDVTVGGVQSLKVLSNAARFPDGTAALPSITFLNETDTGMYRIGANTVGFGANSGINFSVSGAVATSATYLTAAGAAATGNATASIATLTATSTDTNASIHLVHKGNGAVAIKSSSAAQAGTLQLFEPSSGGSDFVSLRAPDLADNVALVLPSALPTNNGQPLVGNTDGTLTFQPPAEFNFLTTNGKQLQILDSGVAATSWLSITAGTGIPGLPTINAEGAGADINVLVNTKGTSALVVANQSTGGVLALLNPGGTGACSISVDPAFVGVHNVQLPSVTAPAGGTYLLAATRVTPDNTALSYVQTPFFTASGTLTSADILGMSATPAQILAAPGAGFFIKVLIIETELVAGGTPYAAGGNVIAQYDTTALGAGTPASASASLSIIIGSVDTVGTLGQSLGAFAKTTVENKPIYLSNQTAPFTLGDGTLNYTILYSVIAVA